ncbi:DrmB family protein [Aeromonas salmonicida]|uniref:DrmB family protein n=1 Tax=Aeromonas salmonicida TaxID=645 RepID=UPI0035A60A0D
MSRTYRSSQLISPFGPGSIIEIGDESLVLVDPQFWPKKLQEIKLDRLAKEAGVWSLRKPPVIQKKNGHVAEDSSLMTVRFPKWMFCPRCRRMEKWTLKAGKRNEDGVPVCKNINCKDKILVPMRFVAACEHGHLQDVPWDYWAHKGKSYCEHPELYFKSNPEKGSGLDALYVECGNPDCGAHNSFKELLGKGALGKYRCTDSQPWEFKEPSDIQCEQTLRVLQRGASNLYYPIIRSALDIPHESVSRGSSVYKRIKESDDFEFLMLAVEKGQDNKIQRFAMDIAKELGLTVKDVIAAVMGEEKEVRTFKIPKDGDLRLAEWDVLTSEGIEQKRTDTFKARVASWAGTETFGFEEVLSRVVLLDKLRSVSAFCGFERVAPNDNVVQPKSSLQMPSWLPAMEVYGEGIFLEFSQAKLSNWENSIKGEIKDRLNDLKIRHANTSSTYLPEPDIKFLILHTLAHLLIRQLSFESGYSSGSLRERIYAGESQAGILIYTADGDSEGSLGGLVLQGEANRLFPAILAALETANWCSNDPVCSEMEAQGVMGLNKAACHSCTLISETSCEHNNLLLDRKILIGCVGYHGFFSDILARAQEGYVQ